MTFKDFFDRIVFYISVPKCVSCRSKLNFDDIALCKDCRREYYKNKDRNCSLCAKQIYECTCTNKYLSTHNVKHLVKVFRYVTEDTAPSNRLIYSLKRDDREDVLGFLSSELYFSISSYINSFENVVFTNVPRRKRSVIKYGIDHSALLAKRLAKMFSAEYYQPLISKTKKDQKKTAGDERRKNAIFDYKYNVKELKGKRVILIDDVVTTGSSLGACAMLLRGLGVKEVIGATLAIAYKDPYKRFKVKYKRYTK